MPSPKCPENSFLSTGGFLNSPLNRGCGLNCNSSVLVVSYGCIKEPFRKILQIRFFIIISTVVKKGGLFYKGVKLLVAFLSCSRTTVIAIISSLLSIRPFY
jgi:hypothetical protein